MYLKRLIFLLIIFCAISFTPHTDSLLHKYQIENNKEKKLTILLAFCSEFKTFPVDTLKKYAAIAINMAAQQRDHAKATDAYQYLGRYYLNTNQLDSALWACDQADHYAALSGKELRAKNKCDMMRGTIFTRKNQHENAIEWFYKILPRVENQKDTFNYLGILNGIGLANMELGRHEEAVRWFKKVISYNAPQFEHNKAPSYLNIASSYGALKGLDSAYIRKAIEVADKYHNLAAKANSLNIYANILIEREKFADAEKYILESITIRKQIGDPFYIVSDMAQLSDLYSLQKKYEAGIAMATEALEISKRHGIEAKYPMIYKALYSNYYGKGDYKKSADMMQLLMNLKDSVNNKATAKSLAEMDVKYETAKKEHRIKEQQYEISRKNILLITSIAIIGLLTILGYTLYNRYKIKQQARLQQAIIREQDEAAKAIINAEENERSRMSQTLHDGLGKLLSAAKMNLQAAEGHLKPGDQAAKIYANTLNLLEESIKEMRGVSHQMVTNNVIRKGLANALKEMIEKIESNQLNISLDVNGLQQDIDPEIQLVVYRVLQESINNVIKHAKARKLDIRLNADKDMLTASVEDNGRGFDISNAKINKGIGLDNIETRIKFLKGKYNIDSSKENGTSLQFEIPL